MKVTVKNFGPIGEAKDIRISPMTLFVGPSNTGKSYLAVLLYAVAEVLRGDFQSQSIINRHMQKNTKDFDAVAARIIESGDVGMVVSVETKKIIRALCQKMFPVWAAGIMAAWREKIVYCFGEEGQNLIQDENMSIVVQSDDGGIVVDLLSPQKSKLNARVLSKAADMFWETFSSISGKELDHRSPFLRSVQPQILAASFRSVLYSEAPGAAHYLPAIRGGIMQSHRGLVDATMAQVPFTGLSDDSSRRMNVAPMFTGVLSDFMRKLIDLSGDRYRFRPRIIGERPRNRNIAQIGGNMEREVMDGEIKVRENETGYPDYRYKFSRNGEERELSLNNTSSMVSELAPVSIFVRHHLGRGHLFIVEEPEAHLHPDGQRAITDILVELADAGVFVLATTHSDIVLEQISNAVRSAKLGGNGKSRKKGGSVSLDIDKVFVYAFDSIVKGKTKVKKVDFDGTDGFMSDDHLRASTDLYNDTVGLMDATRDD